MSRNCSVFAVLGMTIVAAPLAAQTESQLHLMRLHALPVGALPPVAILMPASRNQNYLVGRLQVGRLQGTPGDRDAAGAGVDIQWRGGSSFGLTAGYQRATCAIADDCPSHPMFGGRAKLNLLTGGPTFAALIGDASATTTFGVEIGAGYAPNVFRGRNACAVDVSTPVSISMFQLVRVVAFGAPGIAWDTRCPFGGGSDGVATSATASAGIGFHQLGARGLDVTLGAQQIFRSGSGTQLGVGVTYVRLPRARR